MATAAEDKQCNVASVVITAKETVKGGNTQGLIVYSDLLLDRGPD